MDKKFLLENSRTFCMMPWMHQYINTTGDVYPCCTATYDHPVGNVKQNTIVEIWNNEHYRKLRHNMLNEIKSPACENCYKHEDESFESKSSFRHWANRDFGEYIDLIDDTMDDGFLPNMDLKYFDVRWSNICNFKCRICGDWFSSSWAAEAKQNWKKEDKSYPIFIKATDNNANLLDQFKPYLPGMKVVYFAGGEPLITEEHYQVLEFLIENKATDMLLRYNSNVSVLEYKDKKILDYWKHFSKIDLYASLESWGPRAEYIRNGTVWSDVVNNLTTIKNSCPQVNVQYNSVVGMWNFLTLIDFLEELERLNVFDPKTSCLTLYRQLHPNWQSMNVLPDHLKEIGINKIKKYLQRTDISSGLRDRLNEILDFAKQTDPNAQTLSNEAKGHIAYIDKIRKEDFAQTFPELREWYENN